MSLPTQIIKWLCGHLHITLEKNASRFWSVFALSQASIVCHSTTLHSWTMVSSQHVKFLNRSSSRHYYSVFVFHYAIMVHFLEMKKILRHLHCLTLLALSYPILIPGSHCAIKGMGFIVALTCISSKISITQSLCCIVNHNRSWFHHSFAHSFACVCSQNETVVIVVTFIHLLKWRIDQCIICVKFQGCRDGLYIVIYHSIETWMGTLSRHRDALRGASLYIMLKPNLIATFGNLSHSLSI